MSQEARKTKAEQGFADQLEAAQETLPGTSDWALELRATGRHAYLSAGLPHRRVEEWKYTDLRTLVREAYPPAPTLGVALTGDDIAAVLGEHMAAIDAYRIVIVDGQLRTELSDMDALGTDGEINSLAEALDAPSAWVKDALGAVNPPESDPVAALNMALMTGGVAVRLADGACPDKALHIVHVHAAQTASHIATRNLLVIGERANATVIESYVATSQVPAQRSVVTEAAIGKGARLTHVKYQNEADETVHLSSWMMRLEAEATYAGFQFSTGAAVARNQAFVRFAGEGAVSHVNGAVMLRGKQHNDTTMVIDHAVPGCESREHFKAVIDDDARAINQCKAIVQPHAQKSDGHQMAQALLLSETAEFDSKPELEIFADDVVCGHGSTSGQVDDELLFYLRSRGIPEAQARALLVAAFVGEVVEKIEDEPVREALLGASRAWLGARELEQ
ncbi:MAG: Fe-S cluster assembly protein SufD [Hyphomicrobiales bacterium]|nr:Fe-S cluster assembly protein SufD [Hyphomicrobiales bacterium]